MFNKHAEKFYLLLKFTVIILYVISVFKIWSDAPKYLKYIDLLFNFVIGVLLIMIYNPFNKKDISTIHKRIAFSAGIAILINSAIMKYIGSTILNNKLIKNKIPNIQIN
tara:strand:+ start:13733 stop:14059 length:327 start_codon:yes stop_codon:yes gene_type:complete